MAMPSRGIVYLIGAGPGDVGLFTVRGAELLGRAEVVLYDGLVNPAIVDFAPSTAERIAVGRHGGVRVVGQDDVNRMLVELGRAGRVVARLKGGDPYVYGRAAEEGLVLAEAGIPFEVVPGVSSFHAVPAYAGIAVAGDEPPAPVTVLSGQEDFEKAASAIDWETVATVPGTKVVLMGMHRLEEITRSLMAGGASGSTPVTVVRRGTTASQETLDGTLETIADLVRSRGMRPPAVVVIGEVVRGRDRRDWFGRSLAVAES